MNYLHPEFLAARNAIAVCNGTDRLTVVKEQADRLVRCDDLTNEDIECALFEAAEAFGVARQYGSDTVRHVIKSAFDGFDPGIANGSAKHGQGGDDQISFQSGTKPRAITALNVYDFLATKFPPRQTILSPWLQRQGLAMLHAPRGLGKTHIALGVAWACATGTAFLNWKASVAHRVLILDGEMPAVALQERMQRVCGASEVQPPSWEHLRIAAADLQEFGLPDLASPDAQKFYAPLIEDRDLIIVDNLSTLCRGLKENEADSWTPVQNWALSLRRAGKSVLFIHHGGKSGQQRGSSRKEDVLDTVLALRRPPDYCAEEGARFEVHFEKTRGFHGDEAKPFEAHLVDGSWLVSDIKSGDDDETLRALRKQGLTIRDISERTGIPRSTVSRRLDGGDE